MSPSTSANALAHETKPVLSVRDLHVRFPPRRGRCTPYAG